MDSKSSMNSVWPRIHLPRPALVAFVVFDRAAVIASIAISPPRPSNPTHAKVKNNKSMPLPLEP